MIDKANEVFSKVMDATEKLLCKNDNIYDHISQTFQNTPPKFPFLFFDQKDNPSVYEDLSNNENAVQPLIQIETYTKGITALSDGKKIHKLSDTAMRNMGFRRTFGPQQVTNLADTSITRIITRYTRTIGSSDVL